MTQTPTISLLCPTRGRPLYVVNNVASILETAAEPERLELLFYVDRDDAMLIEYERTFAELTASSGGLKITGLVGDPVGTPRALNAMAALSRGQYLMISNDDLVFTHRGWDREIDRAAAPYPDGVFNIFFNDGYFGDKLSCFPIVGRAWYEALSYIAPVLFEHSVVDWWIHHLGKFVGRNLYLDHVEIEHRHFDEDGSGERFNWQRLGYPKRRMDRDNAYFQIFERYLRLDAQLLRDAIAAPTSNSTAIKLIGETLLANL